MAGNTPFRYFKQSKHRGGQQDALVVHWPKGIQAKGEVRSQYHHITDIAPTIADLVPGVAGAAFDGDSLASVLLDGASIDAARPIYLHRGEIAIGQASGHVHGVRAGRWKYVVSVRSPIELYDLHADPLERHNLAPSQRDEANRLAGILRRWHRSNRRRPPRARNHGTSGREPSRGPRATGRDGSPSG